MISAQLQSVFKSVSQRVFRTRAEDTLPHVVTHQRVYIVPTKRGFAFVVALILMLIASVNYSLSLGYALCFILTGLFAATLLHTYRNLAGVEVHDIVKKPGFAGETVTFLVSLKNVLNDSRHGIRVSTTHDVELRTHIDPRDTSVAMLSVPSEQRGVAKLGRITLQSDWPLGLWTCWSYLHVPAETYVYPKPENDPPVLPLSAGDSHDKHVLLGNSGEIAGLRNYREGDSIGSIAWKSVAKGGGMQVRLFEQDDVPTDLALNLQVTGQRQLEDQLSRLCAWVLQAESKQAKFSLDLPGSHLHSDSGAKHYQTALKKLALFGLNR